MFITPRRWTLVLMLCLSTAVHATFLFNQSRLPHSSKFPCKKHLLPTLTHNGKGTTKLLSISSLESKIDGIEGDSIERFSQDVSKVLNELRPELLDETLPGKIIEECESERSDCGKTLSQLCVTRFCSSLSMQAFIFNVCQTMEFG
jgi:hypothetical protein